MAISGSNLTTAVDDTDGVAFTTASITPTANNLVLAAVASVGPTNTTPAAPTLAGNTLTWVEVNSIVYQTAGGNRRRITVFRAMGALPTTGTVVISFGAVTQRTCAWSIVEFSGTDTSGTNGSGAIVQSALSTADASATTGTATLAAFADAANGTFGAFSHRVAEVTTPGSGFTELAEAIGGTEALSIQTEWRVDNDTVVDATWASNAHYGVVAIEIKVAAAGGIIPVLMRQYRERRAC